MAVPTRVHIQFRILGPVGVTLSESWHGNMPTRRCQVLALLLVANGRSLSTSQLIDQIWRRSPPKAAAQMIRDQIRGLRGVLGEAAAEVLLHGPSGYQIVMDECDLDAKQFSTLLYEGRRHLADGKPVAAISALERALSIWNGEVPLANVRDIISLAAEAQALEEMRFQAEELLATAYLHADRAEAALLLTRRMISRYPARERQWFLTLTALTALSRRAEATEAYHQAYQCLVRDTGLESSALMLAVHQAILHGHSHQQMLGLITGSVPPGRRSRTSVRGRIPC